MSVQLTDLTVELTEFHDAPLPLQVRALRESADAFCRQSGAWEDRQDFFVAANLNEFTLQIPAYGRLLSLDGVKRVLYNGQPLLPAPSSALDEGSVNWETETAEDARYWLREGVRNIRIVPTPKFTGTKTLKVVLALRPTRTATELDDQLVDHWSEAIICGAKAWLYGRRGASWYDANESYRFEEDFKDGVLRAKVYVAKSGTPVVQSARLRPFA